MKTWIGIDVSKATLAVCLLPQQQLLACSNDPLGHAQLLGHLQGLDIGNVLLEATGGYERPVIEVLARAGISIFAVSTFDTDYILVKAENLGLAQTALEAGGYSIETPFR